jgi:hypothetical protein
VQDWKDRKDLRDMKREQTRARTTRFKIGDESWKLLRSLNTLDGSPAMMTTTSGSERTI